LKALPMALKPRAVSNAVKNALTNAVIYAVNNTSSAAL
jgi:hypothetical protein